MINIIEFIRNRLHRLALAVAEHTVPQTGELLGLADKRIRVAHEINVALKAIIHEIGDDFFEIFGFDCSELIPRANCRADYIFICFLIFGKAVALEVFVFFNISLNLCNGHIRHGFALAGRRRVSACGR